MDQNKPRFSFVSVDENFISTATGDIATVSDDMADLKDGEDDDNDETYIVTVPSYAIALEALGAMRC